MRYEDLCVSICNIQEYNMIRIVIGIILVDSFLSAVEIYQIKPI